MEPSSFDTPSPQKYYGNTCRPFGLAQIAINEDVERGLIDITLSMSRQNDPGIKLYESITCELESKAYQKIGGL